MTRYLLPFSYKPTGFKFKHALLTRHENNIRQNHCQLKVLYNEPDMCKLSPHGAGDSGEYSPCVCSGDNPLADAR